MGNNLILEYKDQMAFHPGVYITDILTALEMTQQELANRMATSPKNISQLVNGNVTLTPAMAYKLSKVLDLSTETWLNIQAKYDIMEQKIQEDKKMESQKRILDQIDYKGLVKRGFVKKTAKSTDKIKELCKLLKIASLEPLTNEMLSVDFRAGKIEKEKEIINTNLWIELVNQNVAQEESLTFDPDILSSNLSDIKKLMSTTPEHFIPKLKQIFKTSGVHFVLLPSIVNAKPKGMVMWRDNKTILALSNKGLYADIFWLTLFHEIGHILLHPHSNFVELEDKDAKEKEADTFATELLTNPNDYHEFIKGGDYSIPAINELARKNEIPSYIVIGRLQKEGHIRYDVMNQYKMKYNFEQKSIG